MLAEICPLMADNNFTMLVRKNMRGRKRAKGLTLSMVAAYSAAQRGRNEKVRPFLTPGMDAIGLFLRF